MVVLSAGSRLPESQGSVRRGMGLWKGQFLLTNDGHEIWMKTLNKEKSVSIPKEEILQ